MSNDYRIIIDGVPGDHNKLRELEGAGNTDHKIIPPAFVYHLVRNGCITYVGRTGCIRIRAGEHYSRGKCFDEIRVYVFKTRQEALKREADDIKKHVPQQVYERGCGIALDLRMSRETTALLREASFSAQMDVSDYVEKMIEEYFSRKPVA